MRKTICAGRRNGDIGVPDQFERNRMRGHAHADEGAACGDCDGHGWRSRQQQSEGTGPEGLHQAAGGGRDFGNDLVEHLRLRNVHDDRIPRRPLFGGENAFHGLSVKSVGAESVHRLRRQRNQAAGSQDLGGAAERLNGARRLKMRRVHSEMEGPHKFIFARESLALSRVFILLPLYSLIPMAVETEIKFRVADRAALAQQLEAAGFRLQTPRSFESNVLYDTPDRQLRARTEILRIRSYAGRWTLTHKRLPGDGPGEDRHKHRIETETEVADGGALEEVFRSLGLVAAFRYEKWRTEWQDSEGHCVVDETPIGDYAELEGPAEWIDRTAGSLGVRAQEYLTLSYGRLFDLWREQHRSGATDLTFEAVAQAPRQR